MASPVRFWHLSDLHLYPCNGPDGDCDCEEETCAVSIKRDLLKAIAHDLRHTPTPPQLLLLTGDIFERTENKTLDAARFLQPLFDAASARGTEVFGILGDDGHDGDVRKNAAKLGWGWLMKAREVRVHGSGVKVVAVDAGSEAEVKKAVGALPEPGGPSILLAHASEVAADTPHNYRALGHIHTACIARFDESHVSGRPGHLYSYWDGPGKAWPVFMIAGIIDAKDGRVEAWRVPLEGPPYFAPATRQIYGDVGGYEQRSGALYLVHAPTERWFFEGCGLEAQYVEFLPKSGAVKATYRFTSKGARDDVIRKILEACPSDIFVTPATDKGYTDRIKRRGGVIAASEKLFGEFVEKTFKRIEGTQTSDFD